MDEISYKAVNLEFTSLDMYIEETMEVQPQHQVGDVIELKSSNSIS